MIEAQNEYRRRRGAREITEADAQAMAREDEQIRERARRPHAARSEAELEDELEPDARGVARALIVGCGCRGRSRPPSWPGDGWVVRGTSRTADGVAAIEAAGSRASRRTPTASGPFSTTSTTSPWSAGFWPRRAASDESLAALHGARLERLLEELVDTPVRGFVYEARGRSPRSCCRAGRQLCAPRSERWRIPAAMIEADPGDPAHVDGSRGDAVRLAAWAAEGYSIGFGGFCGAPGCAQGACAALWSGGWSAWSIRILAPNASAINEGDEHPVDGRPACPCLRRRTCRRPAGHDGLAFAATVPDVLKVARDANSAASMSFQAFGVAALIYLAVSFALVAMFRRAERRWLAYLAVRGH